VRSSSCSGRPGATAWRLQPQRRSAIALQLWNCSEIAGFFEVIVDFSDVSEPKPSPWNLSDCSIAPRARPLAMHGYGDAPSDVLSARCAGCRVSALTERSRPKRCSARAQIPPSRASPSFNAFKRMIARPMAPSLMNHDKAYIEPASARTASAPAAAERPIPNNTKLPVLIYTGVLPAAAMVLAAAAEIPLTLKGRPTERRDIVLRTSTTISQRVRCLPPSLGRID